VPIGVSAEIVRLEEDLQAHHETLLALEAAGIMPGVAVTVLSNDEHGARVRGPRGDVELDPDAAAAVRVRA
jgi:hypothetical protein